MNIRHTAKGNFKRVQELGLDIKYTTTIRIALHLILWILLGYMYYRSYSKFDKTMGWLLVGKDLVAVTSIFYIGSYFILDRYLFKGKFFITILFMVLSYLWWAALTYFVCLYLKANLAADSKLLLYANVVVKSEFTGIFSIKMFLFYFLDFLYLLFPPLSIKLMKSTVAQSNKRIALERDNLNLEINFLKAQINPHFLFNTLNNIYRMVNKQDEQTGPMVLHLAGLMRYTLYESNDPEVLLSREIEFIRDYLELESIRYGDEVQIDLDIDKPENPLFIVPLIIFPFIENAFKHGPDASIESAWIKIKIKVLGNQLFFEVANSCTHSLPKTKFGGLGIANIQKRLLIHYPNAHELIINNEPNQYTVTLKLQLK
ncbi:sensor histidine kinase [Pedobacter petrophilus]|uniref:sensor histidine kinase n=1 Tax=Pedobacter petrophilus TaxID=1908241 RepID=UPI00142F1E79|nr:histidine kinase [Pedobacter petrophilus]